MSTEKFEQSSLKIVDNPNKKVFHDRKYGSLLTSFKFECFVILKTNLDKFVINNQNCFIV